MQLARTLGLALALGLAAPALAADKPAAPEGPEKITPSKAGAAQYGPDANLTCKSGGVTAALQTEFGKLAKGKPAAVADGRLCAAAESLLGWERPEQPPESLRTALSWHFGLPTTFQHVLSATIETEDWRVIGERFAEAAAPFVSGAAAPRFGIATKRLKRETTKVVLVLLDAPVELAPVPRQLPAGGTATLAGKLGGLQNPKVYVCDASGKFEAPKQAGDELKADLRCGDKPGPLLVDVRADVKGSSASVARLSIACGTQPEAAFTVAPPAKGAVDAAAAEKKLFDAGNQLRAAAELPALVWSDDVAGVARGAAKSYQAESQGGGAAYDVEQSLKAAGVSTVLVLQNPAAALSVEEIAAVTAQSPVNRCNLLAKEANTGGVGVATTTDQNGHTIVYATELLVRELPPVDEGALREKLRGAIAARRQAQGAPALAPDATLDDVAQKYAQLLARTQGQPPKAEESAVVAPLYKAFRSVNLMSGVKPDALDLVQEPGMTGAGKALGVGVAGGQNPVLGKNAPYVVVIVGTPHDKKAEAAAEAEQAAPAKKKPAGKKKAP